MDATAEFSVNFAFVLEPDRIKKIHKLLTERIAKPSISARCADDMVREFADVRKLLDYENPRDRRILSLTFRSRTDDRKKQARISFADHSWGTITVAIDGAENTVTRLKDELGEIVDGTKAWHWRISRTDFIFVMLLVMVFGYLILQYYKDTFEEKDNNPAPHLIETLGAIAIATVIVASFPASTWVLNWIQRRFFPVAIFAIGQESKRFHIDDRIRWSILGGFLVSFAASIVVAGIWSV